MEVTYKKYKGKEKIEFLLVNFDYEDGNDYLAKIFCEKYGMVADEKKDYIYYSILNIHANNITYELLWHEDTGNSIYSLEQDDDTINELESRLKNVLDILNKKIIEGN